MLEEKVKVSVVSYLNSKPFAFGIENSTLRNQMEVTYDNPAKCAQRLIDGDADVGLVPVAVIPFIKNAEIISDYCIAAEGKVESVLL
ncbi:MAG: MqnA/MqnD/SBP family protein, partial [Bacteroidota bacterium]